MENISISINGDISDFYYIKVSIFENDKIRGSLNVMNRRDYIEIINFGIYYPEFRGKGLASILLESTINYIRSYFPEKVISLEAQTCNRRNIVSNSEEGLTQSDLIAFYERKGFKVKTIHSQYCSNMEYAA